MSSFSVAERMQAGKALRQVTPRAAHGEWTVSAETRDPIELLESSNVGRLPDLVPIRYRRMLRNPFTFLRGAPIVMAHDLAATPSTGLDVQACGDCHLTNFGLFATPERNLIFDINDFDETLRAPWEWDLKRLTASFVVAGRLNGLSDQQCIDVATTAARSYREHLREFSAMSPLDILYFRICADELIESAPDAKSRKEQEEFAAKARNRVGDRLLPKITEEVDGRHLFVENPPITRRLSDERLEEYIRRGIAEYRESLADDRRFLFDRYRLEDLALRVVGVGSVGTRCYVALLFCDDQNSLLLQIKEARRSVLEPFAEKCPFANQGHRVVAGQRLMQAASDIFLGWFRATDAHDFYVRQMRDMKFSVPVDSLSASSLDRYAALCGWTLARAHAKSGDAAAISGYLGRSDRFDAAIGAFAVGYADQTESDYQALVQAAESGRIGVHDDDL